VKLLAGPLLLVLAAATWGCGTGSEPVATTSSTVAEPTLQQVVDEGRRELGAPGLLATAVRDGEDVSVASGASDIAGGRLDVDATAPIGSVTKLVTAALTLEAVARGELTLDTSVGELLPGMLRDGDAVTVRMLLAHTSGIFAVGDEGDLVADIGRLTDPALEAEAEGHAAAFVQGQPVEPSVPLLVALAETHDRYGPPGSTFHYSNVNYLLLGQALETSTGTPLPELVRRRIAEPLGLDHMELAAAGDPVDLSGYNLDATGELSDPGNAHLLLRGNGASGSVTSTSGELVHLIRSVVAGELLPPDLTEAMLTPTEQSDGTYGLGFATYDLTCGTFYGHAGGIAGVEAIALVGEGGDDAVVLIANARPTDGRQQLLPLAERVACGELRSV
jgi:D-alanyl-D-alanine carboxypeptidase